MLPRTVSRSARIWHGWKPSVSALTTGTRLTAAIASMRSWPKVRQTIASHVPVEHPGGVVDRLAAAELGGLGVDDERVAARARRCRPRTRPGCASRACRRAPRPPAARPAAGGACRPSAERRRGRAPRSARPGSGRRRAGSAGASGGSSRVGASAAQEARRVEDRRQGGEERVGLRVGEDQRRGEPDRPARPR